MISRHVNADGLDAEEGAAGSLHGDVSAEAQDRVELVAPAVEDFEGVGLAGCGQEIGDGGSFGDCGVVGDGYRAVPVVDCEVGGPGHAAYDGGEDVADAS